MLTCGFDGVLNVWTEDFNLLSATKLSDKSLRNICLLPERIAVASSDFNIYLLDKETFKITAKLEHHLNYVFAMAYNPFKGQLLTGGRDCHMKIWDTDTLELKPEYVGATWHINHLSFHPAYTL